MKRILIHHEVCSGCRACEVACVVQHEGCFSTAAARIRVFKDEALGLDHPHVCRLCGKAPCISACPTGALTKNVQTGVVHVNDEICIGCGACVQACPFDAAFLHPETGRALICDLCGGDPACVRRCATGAIAYGEPARKKAESTPDKDVRTAAGMRREGHDE